MKEKIKNIFYIVGFVIFIFTIYNYFWGNSMIDNIKHFNQSIDYANQATQVINVGNPFEEIAQEDIHVMINLNKKALEEAKLVDIDKLNRDYGGFGTHYRDEFIHGLELSIEGFENSDNQKIIESQILLDKWGSWYNQNIEEIKTL